MSMFNTSALDRISAGVDKVESPSAEWLTMARRWELLEDLLGGTLRMRQAREKWLPREPLEAPDKYELRLARGVLFEGLKDTLSRICAKPFTKEISTKGDLTDIMLSLINNTDQQGSNLTAFAYASMWDAAVRGKTHILVDFPQTGGGQTLAQERTGRIRPYFTAVSARDLIGWKVATDEETGEQYLAQARIREQASNDLGAFASERIDRIRVLEPGTWALYERAPKDREYLKVDEGELLIGGVRARRIPLVTVYFNRTGYMTADPPLEGLAWLNMAHWQSTCDHRNYLRFARIGMLMATGFLPEEIEDGVKISANSLTTSSNPDADLHYVEHEGKAFDAGVKDLALLEERMEALGMRPLIEGTARSTATGAVIDENKQDSQAQAWVRALEGGLYRAFEWAAQWAGEELPKDFDVNIFNDFALSARSGTDVTQLLEMRTSVPAQISHETFLNEVRKRGVLSDDVNTAEELERVGKETLDALRQQGA